METSLNEMKTVNRIQELDYSNFTISTDGRVFTNLSGEMISVAGVKNYFQKDLGFNCNVIPSNGWEIKGGYYENKVFILDPPLNESELLQVSLTFNLIDLAK